MMEMPPLPEMDVYHDADPYGSAESFSEAVMLAYGESCARMAREEERERCARICEELIAFDEDDPGQAPADHIRLGAEPGEWIDDHRKRAAAIRNG